MIFAEDRERPKVACRHFDRAVLLSQRTGVQEKSRPATHVPLDGPLQVSGTKTIGLRNVPRARMRVAAAEHLICTRIAIAATTTIGHLAAQAEKLSPRCFRERYGVDMVVLTKATPHRPIAGRMTESSIPIKSCSWLPSTESAVWVEVGSSGFAARGRILGEEEVTLATSPTRHYLVALARAEAWAEAYKVPVVYVIAPAKSDD